VKGTLFLTREDEDGRTVRWREDCRSIADIMLPELVHHLDRALPTRVFSIRDLHTHDVMLEISRDSESTYTISLDNQQFLRVFDDGILESWEHRDHGLAWREKVSGSGRDRCDIDCGVYWDAGQALLPTTADNIASMEVALTLTSQVGATLIPEDSRQLLSTGQPDEDNAVHVRIARRRQYFEDVMLPILDAEVLPYLKDSKLLPVRSDRIRDRAAMLRNWDRNAANVAKEILSWCGASFTYDPYIPVVSADRLIRDPRGGALHAAMLFVAVARTAALPARLVLGLHPDHGRWRSTVWVEVWAGDWVSVNPLDGSLLEDATHIKLLHAAEVEELQLQAAKLKKALRINVLSVTSLDTSEAGALRTGIVNGVYSNRKYRCAVTAPAGWLMEERMMGDETVLGIVPELAAETRFELQLFNNPYRHHTTDLFETRVRALTGVLNNVRIEQEGEMRFGERKVPFVLYTYSDTRPEADGRRIRTADCIIGIGDRGYVLRFTAPDEIFDSYADALKSILQSVQLFETD
jgi:hypothetical protein